MAESSKKTALKIILELSSKLKSEFIHIVSHQLRAPLTNIKFSLDFLTSAKTAQTKEQQEEYYDILKENSEIFLPNLKNREIQIYHRNEAFSKVNYELTDMLLGTIIGDTVKWNPEGEIAKFAINDKDEFYEILFENYYEKEMIYLNIGLNKGLGTKIIDYCIKKTGFEIEHYKEKRINPSLYPKVKKIGKITQPLEDSSKIIGLHGTKIVIPKVL